MYYDLNHSCMHLFIFLMIEGIIFLISSIYSALLAKIEMEFIKEKTKPPSSEQVNCVAVPVPKNDTQNLDGDDDNNSPSNNFNKRIWVGNIARTVPEFLVLKLVQTFGDIKKFDYAYVKTGPDKGIFLDISLLLLPQVYYY